MKCPVRKVKNDYKNGSANGSALFEARFTTLAERGFCAAVLKDGKTLSRESNRIQDFCDILPRASVSWIDYVVSDMESEAPQIAGAMGFSEPLVRKLIKEPRSGYEDFGDEMGIMLPAIVVEAFDVNLNKLLILIMDNLIVTLHTTEVKRFFRLRRYAETLMRKLPSKLLKKDKITLLLIRLIDENNARNFDHLREIEEHGDTLSEQLSNPNTSRALIGPKIYQMKHALIQYLGGLWATVDALNALRYGDADLLTDDPRILGRITALVGEVQSHIGLAEHLSEVLASGLEVLQSIYNNQLQILNNRMALLVSYLTIIGTALLVPNTIATVMGNSMFVFTPQDEGWYLAIILISTVVATFLAWWVVKHLGLLPSGPDHHG